MSQITTQHLYDQMLQTAQQIEDPVQRIEVLTQAIRRSPDGFKLNLFTLVETAVNEVENKVRAASLFIQAIAPMSLSQQVMKLETAEQLCQEVDDPAERLRVYSELADVTQRMEARSGGS